MSNTIESVNMGNEQPSFDAYYPLPIINLSFWLQWVSANAVGEGFGLGLTALLGFLVVLPLSARTEPWAILLMAALMILAGTLLEGLFVGFMQWRVLRQALPALLRQKWLVATASGALVAWTLGMIPSTLMNFAEAGSSGIESAATTEGAVIYALAAGMGFILGPILAIPQWLALRRHLSRASWWIPANALAWAAGMPIIFIAAGSAPPSPVAATAVVLIALLAAGAIVGAIHGIVLFWLLRTQRVPTITHRR